MSSDTLSQNEIDLLLGGAGSGTAAPKAPVQRQTFTDVQVYDFRRPHRVSKDRLRTLEAMYERLTKSLEGWLLGRIRGQIELRLQSVEQFSFGEFVLSLPIPCASYIVDVHDSGGQQGVIDFGHDFAYFMVDRLFGGSGPPSIPDRAMTPIERMALRGVAERVMTQLSEVWHDYVPLDLLLSGFESIPEILRVANREDPVLVAIIEIKVENTTSMVSLCLPFTVLEKFFTGNGRHRVNVLTGSEREREMNRESTETSLRATHVSVSARLPEFRMQMRDLAALRVGGVLSTGISCRSELEVRVGDQPRFRAAAGRVGPSLAVRVLETIGTAELPSPPSPTESED